MAKAKIKNKQLPTAAPEKTEITGDHIPTPQDLPQRKPSLVASKLAGWCTRSLRWPPQHLPAPNPLHLSLRDLILPLLCLTLSLHPLHTGLGPTQLDSTPPGQPCQILFLCFFFFCFNPPFGFFSTATTSFPLLLSSYISFMSCLYLHVCPCTLKKQSVMPLNNGWTADDCLRAEVRGEQQKLASCEVWARGWFSVVFSLEIMIVCVCMYLIYICLAQGQNVLHQICIIHCMTLL